jgi:hypothetical protein
MFDTGLIAIASADEVALGVGPGVGFEVALGVGPGVGVEIALGVGPGVGVEIVDGCSVMDGRLPI